MIDQWFKHDLKSILDKQSVAYSSMNRARLSSCFVQWGMISQSIGLFLK